MVTDSKSTGWFHCGRCGDMFRATMGDAEMRRCATCGRDPSHDQWDTGISFPTAVLPSPRVKESVAPDRAPRLRRKRKKKTLLIMILLWCGFLVFLGNYLWKDTAPLTVDTQTESGSPDVYLDNELINKHLLAVYRAFTAYVVAANNEQRTQVVLNPIRVATRMVRFFELNPLIRVNSENIKPLSNKVLHLPEGPAIEVYWASGDRFYDTVFFQEDGEWRLDWEHFARYSDFPLSLFLAGTGPEEAEFRLFARERLGEERKQEPDISVVFYSAVTGKPRETGVQTPSFLVPRGSPFGQRLTSAFQQAREGRRPFGSQLEVEEPGDLIRVRVRIRRTEVDGVRKFEITDLPACHWYGMTDDTGVPEGPPEPLPAGDAGGTPIHK